jgi:hypothetical protein
MLFKQTSNRASKKEADGYSADFVGAKTVSKNASLSSQLSHDSGCR